MYQYFSVVAQFLELLTGPPDGVLSHLGHFSVLLGALRDVAVCV